MKKFVVTALIFAIALMACAKPRDQALYPAWHPFKSAKAKERYLADYDAWAKSWPVPSETRMVNTTFGSTFVRISGPAGAPPLILLHGVAGNGLQWMPNARDLSARFRIYVVDIISENGRSVYTRLPKNAEDYNVWLDGLLDGLGLKKGVNMMGLSFGGWLTAHYALARPDRLNKAVLAAPVGAIQDINPEWIKRAILTAVIPRKSSMDSFAAWQSPYYTKEQPAAAQRWYANAFLAFRSFRGKPMVPPTIMSDDELKGIKVPVLFLAGDHEVIFDSPKAFERLHRVAPAIRTLLVKDACHDLTAARAGFVDAAVTEFILGRK